MPVKFPDISMYGLAGLISVLPYSDNTAKTAATVVMSASGATRTNMAVAVQSPCSDMEGALGWQELATVLLKDSRPLKDWELNALDEFTWSELES